MTKLSTLLVASAAITIMAGCQRSPLIGKWKIPQGTGQSCGEYSGFEFNHSSYTALLTNGTSITGPVTYAQHNASESANESFSATPKGGYDLNGIHYTEFVFTLDQINGGIRMSQACEFVRE
jgi:hypothetical protein